MVAATKKKKKKRMEHEQVVTDDRPEVVDVTPDVSLGDSDEEGTEGGMDLIVPDGSTSQMEGENTIVHDEANNGHREEVEEEQECADEDRNAAQNRNEEIVDMQVETSESSELIADRYEMVFLIHLHPVGKKNFFLHLLDLQRK